MGVRTALLFALVSLVVSSSASPAADFPVYPVPLQVELTGGRFDLAGAEIVFFSGPDDEMAGLASHLSQEVAARHRLSLTWRKARQAALERPVIALGLLSDPGMIKLLDRVGLRPGSEWEVPEAYRLAVTPELAVIAGHDLRGLFYGIQSFIQLIETPQPGKGHVKAALIGDKPFKPVRGVHVYLPARQDIPFFKNFIRTMAHFKLNTLIVEVGGGMRLDDHPEINLAWEDFCRAFYDMGDPFLKYGEQVPLGPQGRFQASVHTELAGGSWLTKEEVRDIVEFARGCHLDVVPEIQSLTHTYYLVLAHREIAEIPEAAWPDSYDPSNPGSYDLLFDVIDEYLEVFRPEWVHIGHDEWRAGIKGNTGELFAGDVLRIYRYLKSRGVKTMMWADHLVKGHNMQRRVPEPPEQGVWYAYPSTEGAAEIISGEAKDILMLNWSWGVDPSSDRQLAGYGWSQIFGNFSGAVRYDRWHERLSGEGVLGAEMSTWCLADELSFGQNGSLLNMLLSQSLLWSSRAPGLDQVYEYLAAEMPQVRELLSCSRLPSLETKRGRPGYAFVPLSISPAGNSGRTIGEKADLSFVPSGEIEYRGLPFRLGKDGSAFAVVRGAGEEVAGITVESCAASLLFLHVAASTGEKGNTYNSNYPEDTAELIGYYRVKYADGLEETVPVRYGRNIARYGGGFPDQLYFAHTVKLTEDGSGKPVLAYACEWVNPRPNRRVSSVDLVGVGSGSGACPVLLAVTVVKPPFTE